MKTETSPEKTAQAEAIKRIYAEDVPHEESPVGFFGGIVARPDGRLFAFTSKFQLTVSEDGGKTWSPKHKLGIDDPSNMITGAISMSDGSLGIWTESWGEPMYFWKSADGARTWSKRAEIAPEGAPYHGNVMIETSLRHTGEGVAPEKDVRPFAPANASFEGAAIGRLVIAVRQGWAFSGGAASEDYMAGGIDIRGERIFFEGHGQQAEMCITYVHYSDDGGLTWRRSHPIFIWRNDGHGGIGMADEPNVAELKDGRLLMFVRNPLGRFYQTTSADGGRTWAYPTPTELPSSLSPCCLRRIVENEHTLATGRAGDLLCVWNNVSHDEIKRGFRRGRLSAAISRDDGKTWINAKTVDTAGLPAISGMAALSPPGFVRADRDLGRLPVPIGFVDYADLTFLGDRVLVKYAKKMKNPPLGMPTRIRDLPLDWFYSTE